MTKRLISLVLALIMLLSLCMTACSSDEEEDGEVASDPQRKNSALTIYAITDGKTTEEGLAAVQEKISNYCVAKYKTAIELRFFTAAEYQKALDDMYAKFAAKEAEEKKAKEEATAAAKEEAAYKATLSKEEKLKYEQQKRLEAKAAEEEAKKKAEEEAELIAQGKDVASVSEVQMDILYIPGMEEYYQYVGDELLLDLSQYLSGTFKNIKDFVYPSFFTAATINGGIYGIPNNQAISTNETYFVVNAKLAEKYNVDWTKIRSITDLNDVFAQVKANEAGVAPIYGDFGPEGLSFYPLMDMGHVVAVFSDTLKGSRFTATTTYSALNPSAERPQFMEYCATKALYRQNGYLSDTNESFFLSVQELTEEERMAREAEGYLTILYKGADFNTEAALNSGLFGISKFCREPDRAMEILRLFSNDATFRNLLAFGVEDVHYIRSAENKNVITVIDDSYTMDFYGTGNTLLGYVPNTMDPDYVAKAKAKNLNSQMNPFLGFRYDWAASGNAKWITLFKEWKEFVDPVYEKLCYGTDDYAELIENTYRAIYDNTDGKFTDTYSNFQNNCSFRSNYVSYIATLTKLDEALHIEEWAPITSTEAAD